MIKSASWVGLHGVDGNKKVRGIKRSVLTCSLGFVLAVLATAANMHGMQPIGALLTSRLTGRKGQYSGPFRIWLC